MVPGKETAEEQLLRMIEGAEGAPLSGAMPPPESPGRVSGRRMPDFWKNSVRGLRDQMRRVLAPPKGEAADPVLWNLRTASRILWVALAGIGAYAVFDLVVARPVYKLPVATGSSAVAAETPVAREQKPLSEYLGSILARDPFTGAVAGATAAILQTNRNRLEELSKGLSVAGLDRGANPVAFLEDKEEQKSFMVKVGDDIKGMRVQSISSDGVVLEYEGEQIVLQ